TFPNNSFSASNYWVDPVFTTTLPPTPTPTNTPLPTNTPTPGPSATPTATATATASPTPASCPCTIFASTSAPLNQNGSDTNSVELGAKFTSDQSGYVTGGRSYKLSNNTTTHTGNLW